MDPWTLVIARAVAPVAGRQISGLLPRLTLPLRIAWAVHKQAKRAGIRVSVGRLRRELRAAEALDEMLDSTSRDYPRLRGVAHAALIAPTDQESVRQVGELIATEFVRRMPDRDAIRVHVTQQFARTREAEADLATSAKLAGMAKLAERSARLIESLESQLRPAGQDGSLYVHRKIEGPLIRTLTSGKPSVTVIAGAAGFGKSSLLWGTAKALERDGHGVVMVSAAWFPAVAGPAAVLRPTELIAAFDGTGADSQAHILLLDTADLLLHSESSVEEVLDLLSALKGLGVPTAVTVRPMESEFLAATSDHFLELTAFDAEEMDDAVSALMKVHYPATSVEAGIRLAQDARARQLPVAEILTSPLLLRMLFELNPAVLPSMELDVTGLYREYWRTRVERDVRGRFAADKRDLSTAAHRVGIALLADGTPELDRDSLVSTSRRLEYPSPVDDLGAAVDLLMSRGVLAAGSVGIRFFHQTLFEFAAADGLLVRGGGAEAARLLGHLEEHPLDLFVGAVHEQLLILLGSHASEQAAVGRLVSSMLSSDHPTLAQIALVVGAHHPHLLSTIESRVTDLPTAALRRFLQVVPRVQSHAISPLLDAIGDAWLVRRDDCAHDVVRVLARLAHRAPAEVAELCERLAVVDHFTNDARSALVNPWELYDLILAVSPSRPDLTRRWSLRVLGVGESAETRAVLISRLARAWDRVGAAEFRDELTDIVSGVQADLDDQRARSIRLALGEVLFAQRRAEGRGDGPGMLALADAVLPTITPETPSVRAGAGLACLAFGIIALGEPGAGRAQPTIELEQVIDLLAHAPADSGPPQLVGLCFAPILESTGAARDVLVDRLRRVLAVGLPSPRNARGLSPTQNRATAARVALVDDRVAPNVAAQCLRGLFKGNAAWLTSEYLLLQLPVASVGGLKEARELMAELATDATILASDAQRLFLDAARPHLGDAEVARAFVNVAVSCRSFGVLLESADTEVGLRALRSVSDTLRAEVVAGLTGSDAEQRQAITLWTGLQRFGVLVPRLADLRHAADRVNAQASVARLVEMMTSAVRGGDDDLAAAWGLLADRTDLDSDSLDDPTRLQPAVADALCDLWRVTLVANEVDLDWDLLKHLAFQPLKLGTPRQSPTRLREISTHLRQLMAAGRLDQAMHRLVEVALQIDATPFSSKQSRTACSIFYGVVLDLVPTCGPESVAHFLESLSSLPRVLAEVGTRALLRTRHTRSSLADALEGQTVVGEVAAYAARKLSEQPRERGVDALPMLLATASH